MNFVKYSIGFLSLLVFLSCGSVPKTKVQFAEREFRGVWVATVVNIDWPKSANDPVKKQQEDFIALLDFYRNLNFNAVIVQVRTAGDALYPSQYAPWSRFLTGEEGQQPEPYYDPLEWMIKETHKRGLEFHAWLNPYRATFDLNTDILSKTHDYVVHPEWMVNYGKKYYYNPGLPEVQEHLLAVIAEVIQNYDIDAIHFDDYFYPYKIKGETFDDVAAFERYGKAGETLEDWRRANVNTLIKGIHDYIARQKPWIQFGVSPFGVWRNASKDPAGSDTRAGQTTYDDLYADALLWTRNGWIDYLVPQLYWSMEHPKVAHRKLVAWWSENVENTGLYIGNGAYKIRNDSDEAWEQPNELPEQVSLARITQRVTGNVFFSAKSLMDESKSDVVQLLSEKLYGDKALPPGIVKTGKALAAPKLLRTRQQEDTVTFAIRKNDTTQLRYVVLYGRKNKTPQPVTVLKEIIDVFYVDSPNNDFEITVRQKHLKGNRNFAITCVDLYGRESNPVFFTIEDYSR